jgi:hypothetical protein
MLLECGLPGHIGLKNYVPQVNFARKLALATLRTGFIDAEYSQDLVKVRAWPFGWSPLDLTDQSVCLKKILFLFQSNSRCLVSTSDSTNRSDFFQIWKKIEKMNSGFMISDILAKAERHPGEFGPVDPVEIEDSASAAITAHDFGPCRAASEDGGEQREGKNFFCPRLIRGREVSSWARQEFGFRLFWSFLKFSRRILHRLPREVRIAVRISKEAKNEIRRTFPIDFHLEKVNNQANQLTVNDLYEVKREKSPRIFSVFQKKICFNFESGVLLKLDAAVASYGETDKPWQAVTERT